MKYRFKLSCIIFLASQSIVSSATDNIIKHNNSIYAGKFSTQDISTLTPRHWQPLNFSNIERKTAYYLVRDRARTVVKAVSHAGASGYHRKMTVSTQKYPILKWSWKIENILTKGNVKTKQGDDYAARIYVSFEYKPDRLTGWQNVKYNLFSLLYDRPPPLAVINYIWANHAPLGSIVSNAYSDRVKMFVIQTGPAKTKRWLLQERNIYADYKKAFGEEPGNISGIAIMTDTDNTGESTTAYYGDISFHSSSQ